MDKRNHKEEKLKKFDTGATRSWLQERFDLICPTGLRRLALRYALGAEKHGDRNWCKGMPKDEIINHLMKHVNEYVATGNAKDDNLAAIAWGAFALMHFEEECSCHKAPWITDVKRDH